MKKYFYFLALCLPILVISSCSDDSDGDNDVPVYEPTPASGVSGLFTYENVADDDSCMRVAVYFESGNKVVVYIDATSTDGGNVTHYGGYTYDPTTGFGTITQDDSTCLEFFADEAGYILLHDEDSKYEKFRGELCLIAQNYDLDTFKVSEFGNIYIPEYDDDFGCLAYDSAAVLDIEDIGYQQSSDLDMLDGFSWSVADVAQWAGNHIGGAIASAAASAIMTQIGVGTGAQLNEISLKLDQIQKQLETVLQKIEVILDNQAEAQFNNHKSEMNALANTILPYFEKVMDEQDSVKRSEYLKEFNAMQGTIKTNTFLDNIASLTIQKMSLYNAYDKYIYGCYPWEEQGYVARECFRSLDMITAFKGTLLSVLFYQGRGDTTTMQAHINKFTNYLNYYNNSLVKRNEEYAISQIPNCKIRINKTVDKRDFKNQTWLKNGVNYEYDWLRLSLLWEPGATIQTLAYGNDRGISMEQYKSMGISKKEVNKLVDFHKLPLQTILFDIAKCTNPFSETEMKGKTLCIMRGNNLLRYDDMDETGLYSDPSQMCISAYCTDNSYKLRKVGTPKLTYRRDNMWIVQDIPVFNGWSNYNDQYLWCYPIVSR